MQKDLATQDYTNNPRFNPLANFQNPGRLDQMLQLQQSMKENQSQKFKETQSQTQDKSTEFNYKDFVDFDNQTTADQINNTPASHALFVTNNIKDPYDTTQQQQEAEPIQTLKTRHILGARNTGVAYFDNKENLTLLDAYIAKQLGIKTERLVDKLDIKLDGRYRVDSLTKISDNSKKDHYYADTLMKSYGTMLSNDLSSITGGIKQTTRNALKGAFGIGQASEQSALNSAVLAIAMKSAGGSTQLSQPRIDMVSKELYQMQGINQKGQVVALHLKGVRDSLIQNVKRARASGAHELARNDLEKIKEIDTFLNLQEREDKNGIASFLLQKSTYTPIPTNNEGKENAWNPYERE